MPQKVGWQNAMELLLIGERVNAQRAKEMGLPWKVVPHETLMDEARALAEQTLAFTRAEACTAWRCCHICQPFQAAKPPITITATPVMGVPHLFQKCLI